MVKGRFFTRLSEAGATDHAWSALYGILIMTFGCLLFLALATFFWIVVVVAGLVVFAFSIFMVGYAMGEYDQLQADKKPNV